MKEMDESQMIPAGIFFTMIGGWLLLQWMYCSLVLGFMYGWYVFLVRLNVTSTKFVIYLLASMVIHSPLFSKMQHIFLIKSSDE